MATYKDIQDYVKSNYGYVPKTCWIADVKSRHSLTTRKAANRISATNREHPCPPHRVVEIEQTLSFFNMI